jgi:hypothetical protein
MSRMRYGSHGDLIKVALTVTMLMTWACGGNRSSPPDAAARGTADTATAAAATGEDGCRYLTASDVEPYTGPLVSPPYRATDDAVANRSGDHCLYRGKDGREILFNHSAHGGQIAGTVTRRVPAVMDRLLHDGAGGVQGGSEQHGPADAVMGSAGPGPWDNSNWIPTGTLFAFKGDDFLEVDVSAASGGKPGAIDLATKAIGRLTQPLDYDGSKAVTLAPKPDARVPACQLIPRDRAEGILGSLAGDPQTDSEGTTCTYKVASADGDVSYPVAITWTNGYKQLNTLKRGMSMVSGLMGPAQGAFNVGRGPVGQVPAGGMPAMPKLDSTQQKMFDGFAKMVGVGGMGGAVKRGLKTDTTLTGPWDSAALINGMWLIASRHDVAVTINVGSADYDKAKALLAAACERL